MVHKANLSTKQVFSSEKNQMIKRKDLSLFFRFRIFARPQHSQTVTWEFNHEIHNAFLIFKQTSVITI